MAKKAGIALAYHAIAQQDTVGLVVFGSNVKEAVAPTLDFPKLAREMTRIRPSKETDFIVLIRKAIELFPTEHATKHLVVLSDGLPTVGAQPEKEALQAVALARSQGITVSLVGIGLDKKGAAFGNELVKMGEGRFYTARNLEDLDEIILEDYYAC